MKVTSAVVDEIKNEIKRTKQLREIELTVLDNMITAREKEDITASGWVVARMISSCKNGPSAMIYRYCG